MPRYIWDETRILTLISAINGYVTANKAIPIEWIEEYNELIERKRSVS